MRISDFHRRQHDNDEASGDASAPQRADAGATRLAALNPSLLQDLM